MPLELTPGSRAVCLLILVSPCRAHCAVTLHIIDHTFTAASLSCPAHLWSHRDPSCHITGHPETSALPQNFPHWWFSAHLLHECSNAMWLGAAQHRLSYLHLGHRRCILFLFWFWAWEEQYGTLMVNVAVAVSEIPVCPPSTYHNLSCFLRPSICFKWSLPWQRHVLHWEEVR